MEIGTVISLFAIVLNLLVVVGGGIAAVYKMNQDNKNTANMIQLEMTKRNHEIELAFINKINELKTSTAVEFAKMEERMKAGDTQFTRLDSEIMKLRTINHENNNKYQRLFASLEQRVGKLTKDTKTITPE